MKEVLCLLRLEKNLFFVPTLENGGLEVSFMGGEVSIRLKGVDSSTRRVIGSRESNLCILRKQLVKALVHDSDNQSEIWHMRMGNIH